MADKKLAVHTPGWVNDFKAFIMRGNVVDMAVGVIIGAAFTAIVNSLVKDVFNPVLGLATGGIDFSNLFVTLKGPVEPTLDAAQKAGAVTLNYGVFINAVIQFLIVAIVIFWMVRLLSKLHTKQAEEPAAPPPPTKSEVLLQEIRDALVHQQPHS
ncbi:large-conductance mechanosensitive channel [Acetobacter aceti NRIC 0242]|uniref:Large-conductance mechanosensitive channel n=1 Tax=Acetobacter aceti NBRC 14818 TaxID=887700 RepID=A0AB33I9F6_ACEAC|nr:large conductance mechanosensitive channel protein MscL [Acetobacter aceti]TCS33695.1 large conductance mechanosensitive channel [Acetobacter aceti NBRC 14818]BCK74953.1 large-conductance mechanosensitive channel [Acetobacter aceti NBRC 14818]GAN57088.1 large-conductance mechanosensitive channel [Acetobacter aceti NBRC 14818]GBO81140.1 large-conductance mechanosensitive channel [Acetobacter aceti NRIC 0242]